MKNVWIFCFILLCSGVLFAQDRVEYNYNNYSEMRTELGVLFEQKRFEEAAKMLEWALPEYPDLPFQKKLHALMTEAGLKHKFIVTPDTGHWFLPDLKEQLDSTIEFIRTNEPDI